MEINDFKDVWKDSFNESVTKLNQEEIAARLKIKSKTNSLMKKVKRGFQFELVFGISLLIIAFVYLWPKIDSGNKLFVSLLFFIFFFALMVFVWRKYKKISSLIILQDQLKPTMIKWINILESYVGFNTSRFAKYVIIPFSIVLGFVLGLIIKSDGKGLLDQIKEMSDFKLILSVSLLFVFYLTFIPLSQYINKKLYGKHLDEMKQCLKDLEEMDETD